MEKEELAQYCIDNPYKTPAFQFYPESWYGSGHVSLMSDNERGIHACLIFSAWLESNCGIKNFDDDIISAARSKDIVSIKKVLNLSWFLFNGFWFSIKLCRERVKQIQISGFRSKAASVKWMKNKKHTAKAKQLQCKRYANQEIEIEKEIEIKDRYFKEELISYTELIKNTEWIKEQQKYHPNLDILLSLEKAHIQFWGTEAGWEFTKKKRSKTKNWKRTYENALSLKTNQVWLQNGGNNVSASRAGDGRKNIGKPGYDADGNALGAVAKPGEFDEGVITLEGVRDH